MMSVMTIKRRGKMKIIYCETGRGMHTEQNNDSNMRLELAVDAV